MNVRRRKPAHKDVRGVITDILENERVECVAVLTSRKGAVRGNHYHKKTTQYTYVYDGRIRVYEQKDGARVEKRVLSPGDLLITPPLVRHAVVALKDTTLIVAAHGPRRGSAYEDDTYRLENPLYKPQR